MTAFLYSVVDLDLFVSGSVFRDVTYYPPNVLLWWRQSSSHHQPDQTCVNHFPYMFLICACVWLLVYLIWYDSPVAVLSAELVQALYRYILYLYVIYNYPYFLAHVLFWSQPERQQVIVDEFASHVTLFCRFYFSYIHA